MEILYEYNKEKDTLLKEQRGVSFEEVVTAIHEGNVLDILQHPNPTKYGHQEMYVVLIKNYTYLVPYVKTKNGVFLKTVFPSRKAMKKYCRGV